MNDPIKVNIPVAPVPGPCTVCGNNLVWHIDNGARHPYTPEGVEWNMSMHHTTQTAHPSSEAPVMRVLTNGPVDPVLRMALVDAGVITPEQIKRAEEDYKRTMNMLGLPM